MLTFHTNHNNKTPPSFLFSSLLFTFSVSVCAPQRAMMEAPVDVVKEKIPKKVLCRQTEYRDMSVFVW